VLNELRVLINCDIDFLNCKAFSIYTLCKRVTGMTEPTSASSSRGTYQTLRSLGSSCYGENEFLHLRQTVGCSREREVSVQGHSIRINQTLEQGSSSSSRCPRTSSVGVTEVQSVENNQTQEQGMSWFLLMFFCR
jgi:hypothetical protein